MQLQKTDVAYPTAALTGEHNALAVTMFRYRFTGNFDPQVAAAPPPQK